MVSCTDADRKTADRAVQQFHDRFNAGEFAAIYADAAQEFRDTTEQGFWLDLLESVRQKAGGFESTSITSSRVETGTAGTTVTAVYETRFERLSANEHFFWRISGDSARLLGYHIDAPNR